MSAILRTVDPASEPLSTAEVKTHLRIEFSDDDTYLDALIKAARRYVEQFTRRSLITQTWRYSLDAWPAPIIPAHLQTGTGVVLPYPPLQSVTSVQYTDTEGSTQTFSDYTVDTDSDPGWILPSYGNAWPVTRNVMNAVRITYVAGYGDASTDVPDELRHAMKLLVAMWYENREAIDMVPDPINNLLRPYVNQSRPRTPYYTPR